MKISQAWLSRSYELKFDSSENLNEFKTNFQKHIDHYGNDAGWCGSILEDQYQLKNNVLVVICTGESAPFLEEYVIQFLPKERPFDRIQNWME